MAGYGVTQEGFRLKGFDAILTETKVRARDMFGSDVDLSETSPLLKILEATCAQDSELWKRMEDLYYSNFISTSIGDNLRLLGEDLGVERRSEFATGMVKFTVNNAQPKRRYIVPEGTVVVTAAPIRAFFTVHAVVLNATTPQQEVGVQAVQRGGEGNIPANAITGVDPEFAQLYFGNVAPATIAVMNAQRFNGGAQKESDKVYRDRLLALPRSLWTLEAVRRAVLDVDGIIDVDTFDPLGGVDVSQSYFNQFNFNERLFSAQRRIGEIYHFDVVVAHEFPWPWRTQGVVTGRFERVGQALDLVRPIGVHPNIVQANHIDVGVRAQVIVAPGRDATAIVASIKERLARQVGALKLGGDVLYSQTMRAFTEEPGVADVQNMRLRRCPAAFGRISFGAVPFQSGDIEAGPGENLVLTAREIAVMNLDSALIDIETATQ